MASLRVRFRIHATFEVDILDPSITSEKLVEMIKNGQARWTPGQNILFAGGGLLGKVKETQRHDVSVEDVQVVA